MNTPGGGRAANGLRTRDLHLGKVALYHPELQPQRFADNGNAINNSSRRQESNPRFPVYKTGALTNVSYTGGGVCARQDLNLRPSA
jgi:hypothetical protein